MAIVGSASEVGDESIDDDPAGETPAGLIIPDGEVRLSASGSPQSRPTRKPFRLNIAAKQALFAYAILLPTLAIIVIFRFLPMLQAFFISLHEYDLIRPPKFIWFANFIDLVQDPLFLNSARVSVTYVVFSCVPVWVLSLALALLFNREIRAKNFFRSAAFMPVVMPAVVNAVVWTFMYHQDGVVNTILGWFGLDPIPVASQQPMGPVGGDHHRHLARYAVLHGDLSRRPPGHSPEVL